MSELLWWDLANCHCKIRFFIACRIGFSRSVHRSTLDLGKDERINIQSLKMKMGVVFFEIGPFFRKKPKKTK
ncbi:hypothetical protein A9Q99_23130 [Gammaproteobacteria bacterium 45_16_T64]|nr:hypothetical protein A9Q99_23130 [Gammaproteobacteria bacterium 45_16_T64]